MVKKKAVGSDSEEDPFHLLRRQVRLVLEANNQKTAHPALKAIDRIDEAMKSSMRVDREAMVDVLRTEIIVRKPRLSDADSDRILDCLNVIHYGGHKDDLRKVRVSMPAARHILKIDEDRLALAVKLTDCYTEVLTYARRSRGLDPTVLMSFAIDLLVGNKSH